MRGHAFSDDRRTMTASVPAGDARGDTQEERDYYALSKKVYDVFAPFYDIVVRPLAGMRRKVASMVDLHGSGVLDVATGTGEQAFAFAARGRKVVGVDLSDAMLRVARRKNHFRNVTFRKADATDLPFSDDTFDVACISFALHEMPLSVRKRVLCEMARVTRPGGSILVVDYALPQNRFVSWLVFRAVRLYERDHYADFVQSNLDELLGEAAVRVRWRTPILGGMATVIEGAAPKEKRQV